MSDNVQETKIKNSHVQPLDIIAEQLRCLHGSQTLTWRAIAARPEYQGIPAGTLCAVAKGREPKKAVHRKILGLPPLAVLVDPCPTCGDKAHGYDCSKQSIIEKPAESRRVYNRKRVYPSYAKMRTDDIEQVQKQLARYYPGQFERKE